MLLSLDTYGVYLQSLPVVANDMAWRHVHQVLLERFKNKDKVLLFSYSTAMLDILQVS